MNYDEEEAIQVFPSLLILSLYLTTQVNSISKNESIIAIHESVTSSTME